MKRYKDDVEKTKARDEIKQQTVLMMQENLKSKDVSYKKNFTLALSASFVLFVSTAILSTALISQRSNNEDVPLGAQDQMMQMESYEMSEEIPEGIMAKSEAKQAPEPEAKIMADTEQKNSFYEQDRIICGKIILMDEAFIEVDGKKVYTDDYTYYKDEIMVGNDVEVLVYYIDNVPYAEWIELSKN